METQHVRRQFLHYFQEREHTIVPSSPVVPHEDPTLLFTNAGMNQFKDVFLGESPRDYVRATSSQKCIRAGGKHNDLENVGHTSRHLTFFEMLGNFSFGDYFKAEAIRFAWEVSTEIFGFDAADIWPTVFTTDDEAFELWTEYVPAERITRFGKEENFWAMGDTGPCGPCSELLLDRGAKYGDAKNPQQDPGGERFLEFWNLVFMQDNTSADGSISPLPKPSVDTGAGLERIIALKMGVDSVFETDVLRSLIAQVEEVSGVPYAIDDHYRAPAFHVIADHLRSLAFAIADGAQPSNVDRGYVLRKILRRAVRYGRSLGMRQPFLAKMLPRLVDTMGKDYKELAKSQDRIAEILTLEEESFLKTLQRGGNILNQVIEHAQTHKKVISGDDAFKLKDTYGLPIEEVTLLAKDANLTVDMERYATLEQEAKERSRKVHKTTQQIASESLFAEYVAKNGKCTFLGFTEHRAPGEVTALVVNGQFVDTVQEGEEGMIVLNATPFYAEMGGQVGDTGTLTGEQQQFTVVDCQAPFKGVIAHIGKLNTGKISVGDTLTATIDEEKRQKIENNHTATHLLHWALHQVLGEHVKQAGSVVDSNRLRFDFNHHKALSKEEIRQIEDLVNEKIRTNIPVQGYEIPFEEAQKNEEIKQFFGEKYGNVVRVIDAGFSKELCGGTHTSALGNIGLFRIAKESSIAAGVRRIEAVTGSEAEALSRDSENLIETLAVALKTQPQKLKTRLERLVEENKQLSQELKNASKSQVKDLINSLVSKIETVNKTPFLAAELPISPGELRSCADDIMSKLPSAVLVLAAPADGKCHLIVRVSNDLTAQDINANQIIQKIAPIVGGKGGGKPNSAQAGGTASNKIGDALAKARELISQI